MFINNFDPVAISLFGLDVRWYSLSYIFGIFFGWLYLKKRYLRYKKDLNNLFDDYISYIIFGIIVGGRFGYALFYNIEYFLNNPIKIFFIWEGGMSFHGGLIGVIISSYIFAKKHNQNIFIYLDLVSLVAPIGIFLGRLSNFINSELYGRTTDLPWSVIFLKIDNFPRHPSQIYECLLEGVLLFIILNYFTKINFNRSGVISAIFLIYYSIFRFFIEFTREPDAHIGFILLNLTTGQIISVIAAIIALLLLYFRRNINAR